MFKLLFGILVGVAIAFVFIDPVASDVIAQKAEELKNDGVYAVQEAKWKKCYDGTWDPCVQAMMTELRIEDLIMDKDKRIQRQCNKVVQNICGDRPTNSNDI